MELIDNILEIPGKILEFFQSIIDMLFSVVEAMNMFCDMLEEFDAKMILMAASCGTSEFNGMPIKEAIGTFRYLVGDVAFYMIYLTVLFGCLVTIYKLVVLLYESIDSVVMQLTGTNCKSKLESLLTKIFK